MIKNRLYRSYALRWPDEPLTGVVGGKTLKLYTFTDDGYVVTSDGLVRLSQVSNIGLPMAHTPRKSGDKRPFAIYMKPGTRIGIMTAQGPVYGVVSSVDQGNWIYPSYTEGTRHQPLPGYCRASQVFLDNRKEKQTIQPGAN